MIELLIIILALAIIARESPRLGGCLEILIIVCIIPIVLMILPIWIVLIGLIVLASAGH